MQGGTVCYYNNNNYGFEVSYELHIVYITNDTNYPLGMQNELVMAHKRMHIVLIMPCYVIRVTSRALCARVCMCVCV